MKLYERDKDVRVAIYCDGDFVEIDDCKMEEAMELVECVSIASRNIGDDRIRLVKLVEYIGGKHGRKERMTVHCIKLIRDIRQCVLEGLMDRIRKAAIPDTYCMQWPLPLGYRVLIKVDGIVVEVGKVEPDGDLYRVDIMGRQNLVLPWQLRLKEKTVEEQMELIRKVRNGEL